jgi:hypothetical protein
MKGEKHKISRLKKLLNAFKVGRFIRIKRKKKK